MTETEKGTRPGRERRNSLQYEKSPYLLQHAGNPVDWRPWGEAAFETARREDRPLFVSIGYSTCHWCHVMERESFEDETVAGLLNEGFVPVKVDREERPDIDKVYMSACQMLTGSGGWPLTVFLTPQGKPFYAGTYFPRRSLPGRIGMLELLPQIAAVWRTRRDDVERSAAEVTAALGMLSEDKPGETPGPAVLERAFQDFSHNWDREWGGFGNAPKFPSPHNLMFLLRYWKRGGNDSALGMVTGTLDAMRRGGIFDHLGGGFHRYSTDRRWLAPHFEKMLYDQALIAAALLETYQATRRPEYADTARAVFDYVLRDLAAPEGGFYSAEDADSEGEEGKFYLWTEAEIRSSLTPEEARAALATWNVSPDGNFSEEATGEPDGRNILHLTRPLGQIAGELGLTQAELSERLDTARRKLLAVRSGRVRPLLDTKVLADWNGLVLSALAQGAQVLGDGEMERAANREADFVLGRMRDSRGRLLHCWIDGQANVDGNAEDYAFMIQGLLDLYEAGFDPLRLEQALALNRDMLERFWDSDGAGGFYFSASDSEALPLRKKELYDGASPSANSVAALNLLRLARLTGESGLEEKAGALFRAFSGSLESSPAAFGRFLCALDFALGPSYELVLVDGSPPSGVGRFLEALRSRFIPNKVLLVSRRTGDLERIAPFTRDMRPLDGRATAYVCRDYRCSLPVSDPGEMLKLLEKNSPA